MHFRVSFHLFPYLSLLRGTVLQSMQLGIDVNRHKVSHLPCKYLFRENSAQSYPKIYPDNILLHWCNYLFKTYVLFSFHLLQNSKLCMLQFIPDGFWNNHGFCKKLNCYYWQIISLNPEIQVQNPNLNVSNEIRKVQVIVKSLLRIELTSILYVLFYAVWHPLYNLKNVKNTHGGVIILKLQAEAL